MICTPNNFRNLTQQPGNISAGVAAAVDAIKHHGSPKSKACHEAVDALSDLLSGSMMTGDDDGVIEDEGPTTHRYEVYGYPDRMEELFSLLRRPVGKGVHYATRTVTVDTPFGPVATQVVEAEYFHRQYTGDELMYLRQQDRLKNLRPKPGDIDWLTKPNLRAV